jgi:hypothetical protein
MRSLSESKGYGAHQTRPNRPYTFIYADDNTNTYALT